MLLMSSVSVGLAACAREPSADTLLSEIDATGPKAVLDRLLVDDEQFDAICNKIETAEPTWLEVARRLKGRTPVTP